MRIVAPNTRRTLSSFAIPYGAKLYVKEGQEVTKGTRICEWDPYNAVIISEFDGKVEFSNVVEGVTFREESDDQTGFTEKVVIEARDKTKNPVIKILDYLGENLKTYNLPVRSHIAVDEGQTVKRGEILAKIPRVLGKAGDITGGLPRVTELFEARNPSNPAIVSEIDGEISYGKIKRGNREIIVKSRAGDTKKYLLPLSKQILVQESDYVRAGTPLSDGSISPGDILAAQGPTAVQEYIVNEIQEVYRMQGVKINDKHFEVIVRQMMRKVDIVDPGDTLFLEKQQVDKYDLIEENDQIYGKFIVEDAGDSQLFKAGQVVSLHNLRNENSMLKRKDLKPVSVREAKTATARQVLQGITKAALHTKSFMSAASFQETTKVLNEAAINGKIDDLHGLKENVIVGHIIPGGTGFREYTNYIVGNKDELAALTASKKERRKGAKEPKQPKKQKQQIIL